MMEQINAITFDFGGTFIHGKLNWKNYRRAILDYILKLGFSGGFAKLSKARRGMFKRLRKAREKNIDLWFDDLYRGLLFDLGIHPAQEELGYFEQLYHSFFCIDLVSGIREMLVGLSRRYNLAIISNVTSNVYFQI